MKITQLIFSPTKGTETVADSLTAAMGLPINKVDLTNAKTDFSSLIFGQDELVLIAVPSYGGRIPQLAAQRIVRIQGNQAPCIIVCVYGNRAYEDTLIELSDVAEQCGLQVIAAIAAIAEHSIMHQYASGRPDALDKRELSSFAKKILEKLNGNSEFNSLKIPGKRPYKKLANIKLIPKADNNCISCSLCADQCPAEAISKDNLKTADSNKCISCMRCVVRCPQSARKVNKALVSVAALTMKKSCSTRKENELYI